VSGRVTLREQIISASISSNEYLEGGLSEGRDCEDPQRRLFDGDFYDPETMQYL
jgi:hypothetical protein